jgi:hypothetical protein
MAKTARTARTARTTRTVKTVKEFTHAKDKKMDPIALEPAILIPEPSPLPEGTDRDLQKIYSVLGPVISEAIQRSVNNYKKTKETI